MKNYSLLILLFFISVTTIYSQYQSITHDGIERTYLVHLPENYSADSSYPLIVGLHGGFGNAYNIEATSRLSIKADEAGFIVVYPEGVLGSFNIRTWNAGVCCGYARNNNIDDVGFISRLVDQLIDDYSIESTRVYATGISNGGYMSYEIACELSDKFAAIAPVASSMSPMNCSIANAVPIIHFHSYLDTNIPIQGGIGMGVSNHFNQPIDTIMDIWSNLNQCSSFADTLRHDSVLTYINWGNCHCASENKLFVTRDGGHSWPGGIATAIGDSVSTAINATDSMWEFFKKYTLDCTNTGIETEENIDIYFEVFPNPVVDILTIREKKATSVFRVHMHDLYGNEIINLSNPTSINLRKFKSGIYFMSIQSDHGRSLFRIVKTE